MSQCGDDRPAILLLFGEAGGVAGWGGSHEFQQKAFIVQSRVVSVSLCM